MKPAGTPTLLIIILSISILASCGNIIGNSDASGAFDWESGETIAPADDQHLNEEQRNRYRQDAEKLAVRHINETDSMQTEIPEELVELLYNGLIHITSSEDPKADEVTAEYSVHARNPASPREILVLADTSAPWIDAWRSGTTETGNEEIDEFTDLFDLTLVEYNELANTLPTSIATLRSVRAINVFAVGRLFSELEDIDHAGPDQYTDGNDITVLFFEDYLRYTFEYGFGDCPSGCIGRHLWHFKVFKDGTVEFSGEGGNPLQES